MSALKYQTGWMNTLTKNSYGAIAPTGSNIICILQNDERLRALVYNEMSGRIDVRGILPWKRTEGFFCDRDFWNLCIYLEEVYGFYQPAKCKDTLYAYLSSEKSIHPIREYLRDLNWDGIERADSVLIDYLGAQDTKYVRDVTRKTLIAAVARAFEPGIKFDNVLILCGPQGIGKSSFFSILGGKWYSDSLNIADMKDKVAAEKLQGVWIMELGELAGLKKVDVELLKSFLSRREDKYRHIYAQYVETHPRTGIIVGSTNRTDGFLTDITGNRRFWPVMVNGNGICNVWDITREDVNQIWAECVTYYRLGESLFLDNEVGDMARQEQERCMETDPRQGMVEEYLMGRERVCIMEIWCECLGNERSSIRRIDSHMIEAMLQNTGEWQLYQGNESGKTRILGYGIQRTFIRRDNHKGEEKDGQVRG